MIIDFIAEIIAFNISIIILLIPLIAGIIVVICVNSKNNKKINNNVKSIEKSNIQNVVVSQERRKGNLGEEIVARELEKINRI